MGPKRGWKNKIFGKKDGEVPEIRRILGHLGGGAPIKTDSAAPNPICWETAPQNIAKTPAAVTCPLKNMHFRTASL